MLRRQRAVTNEREAPPPPFRVDVWPDGDVVHVCPVGEIDLDTVSEVRDRIYELRAAGFKRLILDLRAVTFLDSTGIRLVLEADASARADGLDFGLIEGPAKVQRALEVTGLRSALPLIDPSQDGRGRRRPRSSIRYERRSSGTRRPVPLAATADGLTSRDADAQAGKPGIVTHALRELQRSHHDRALRAAAQATQGSARGGRHASATTGSLATDLLTASALGLVACVGVGSALGPDGVRATRRLRKRNGEAPPSYGGWRNAVSSRRRS